MRTSLFALALCLILSCRAQCGEFAQVRARYAAVERAVLKLQPVKRELRGYSLEGGELLAYFQNAVPRKLVA